MSCEAEQNATDRARPALDAGEGVGSFAFAGVLISLATIFGTIIRSKVSAAVVGPSGLGIFAEAQQIFTLAMTVASLAVGPALVSRIARDLRDDPGEAAGRAVGAALVFGAGLGTIAVLVAACVYPFVISSHRPPPASQIVALAVGSLLAIVGQAYTALFTAQAHVRLLTVQSGLTALLATACHVALVLSIGFGGQFYAALAGAACTAAISVWLARRTGTAVQLVWDPEFARAGLRIGTASLVAAGMAQASYTAVRITLDHEGGQAVGTLFNGQYHAALTIGSTYFALVTAGLGTYFFPRYAAAANGQELEREVWSAADFALRVAPPIVLVMLALRGPLIHLLYTDRFDGAVGVLGYQLAGDIAKAVSWAYAGPLLFRGAISAFLITESVGAALLVVLSVYGIRAAGLPGAGMAYAATYLIYMLVAAWVTARSQALHINPRHLLLGALGTVAAAASEAVRDRYPRVDVLVLAFALGWAWYGGLFTLGGAIVQRQLARLR